MAPSKSDKIVIVGAGVYGLSTTLSLLQNGYKNIHLFDKNDYLTQEYSYFKGCDSASSDMNKIFRASYGEKVHYQKLSMISRDQFLSWNKQIKEENFEGGDPIYINSGNIHLTDLKELPEFEAITLKEMKDDAIRVKDPNSLEKTIKKGLTKSSINPFDSDDYDGVLDTTGGIMVADKLCRWVLHLCLKYETGLTVHFGEEVKNLLVKNGTCYGIKLISGEEHTASFVGIFGGAWAVQIIPEAKERLEATGGTVVLCKIEGEAALAKYDPKIFPAWTYKVRDGAMGGLYGFPVSQGFLKIGYRGMKWINPIDGINSKVKTAYTTEKETNVPLFGLLVIKDFIKKYIPEISKISRTRLCWYSDTVDNDFLISYCPYYKNKSVFVGAGDSGHAFMFFGCIGNIVRKVIEGTEDPFLTDLFSWEREREPLNAINLGVNDPRALCNLKMASEKDWILYPSKL